MDNHELTLEELVEAIKAIGHDYPNPVTVLRCGPIYYLWLKEYFANIEAERILNGIKEPERKLVGAIDGIRIFVDKNMPPDEWRFE